MSGQVIGTVALSIVGIWMLYFVLFSIMTGDYRQSVTLASKSTAALALVLGFIAGLLAAIGFIWGWF
jgi:hypothetical protein